MTLVLCRESLCGKKSFSELCRPSAGRRDLLCVCMIWWPVVCDLEGLLCINPGADEDIACNALMENLICRNTGRRTGSGGSTRPHPDGTTRANPRLVLKTIRPRNVPPERADKKSPHPLGTRRPARHGHRNVGGTMSGGEPRRDDWHLVAQGCGRRVRRDAPANEEKTHARLKDGIHWTPLIKKKEGPDVTVAGHLPLPQSNPPCICGSPRHRGLKDRQIANGGQRGRLWKRPSQSHT